MVVTQNFRRDEAVCEKMEWRHPCNLKYVGEKNAGSLQAQLISVLYFILLPRAATLCIPSPDSMVKLGIMVAILVNH